VTKLATKTVGMDLGDKYSQICVLDENGEVLEESRIRTEQGSIGAYFQLRSPMQVVIEAGTHSPWVSRAIEAAGHKVIVANPRRVRLIAENDQKSDVVDAELLARLGRVDPKLLAPIQHRTKEVQSDLVQVRARAALVEARVQLINSVRGLVKSSGHRMPRSSSGAFGKKAAELPAELREQLLPMMSGIEKLSEKIREYDQRIEALADISYAETKPLRQIAGVGALTALTFVATLEDPSRFRSARSVGAFVGLTQRRHQTGKSDPELRISKKGDTYLRKLLVQSASYILGPFGPDSALREWGLALAARGGKHAKKRAQVAVARKLSVLLYRLWVTGEDYVSFPSRKTQENVAA
jgi:transposase